MKKAIQLARRGKGRVSPNPLVGAIIVKNGKIIGDGYHKKAGTEHAEIVAIKKAGKKAKDSTMYVNLEPCCHYGKTPPCTETIIGAGIKEVFIGTKDPNPLVSGNGIKKLEKKGIKVNIGTLENEARKLNEFYFTYMKKKRPFIILKIAQTIDGNIADLSGNSKWITNESARKKVHSLRYEVDAILTGIGTVKKDNPQLTARLLKNTKTPLRIVLDSNLRIPHNSEIVKEGTIIATLPKSSMKKKKNLISKGIRIWEIQGKDNRIDLSKVLKRAYEEKIISILVEAGKKVSSSFLKENLIDKIYIFISNKILGKGLHSFGNLGFDHLEDSLIIDNVVFERLKENFLIKGYVYRNY
ncbi:bifunctional diaminohydroxyphosphoribosylaminopyrimidine deaminase/5-amino-6-(5-phosphoribosylamino)uracil reductase RibD [candidate division WOR-3 bacterium]|nr:bifunctional diaminohydroxyphosphoribosylaminopyrimidine deaminase/5-amino-6-(5-phosphoribosylamino)uracil reductase RibD [candidate division WOR-3 bacterium]